MNDLRTKLRAIDDYWARTVPAGKPGTVSYGEWAAAVDRVFPTDGAPVGSTKVRTLP